MPYTNPMGKTYDSGNFEHVLDQALALAQWSSFDGRFAKSAQRSRLRGRGMPVFSRKWGQGPDGKPKAFDEIITEYPITSGPYTIERVDSGRRIDFIRNPDYWARDLGVTRGQYNFERVIYRYYQDNAISMKDGEIVEQGDAESMFASPQQPYTQALLQAAQLA